MTSEYNNWTTTDITEVYDNPWIKVEHHQVINPSGKPGIYGKVHFKNIAIGIIPLDDELNTWIVGQYRYPLDRYSWEIPMGGGPVEKDILESAKRELREETGISADHWQEIMTLHTSNCVTDETGVVYLAHGLHFGPADFDESEDLKIKSLPFRQVVDMVMKNQITDAISIAGILKLHQILIQ